MRPLYNIVHQYAKNSDNRFHMPGHCGQQQSAIFNSSPFDLTELPGLDNLLNANGVILETEKLIAKSYKAKYALMVTSGSTTCMHIATAYLKNKVKRVACLGDMHKSFYAATMLNDIEAFHFSDIDKLDSSLENGKDLDAVYVTSPNYFGECKDLKRVREICDKYKILFILDAAHAAHFPFYSGFPNGGFDIADISFTSMHKTLAVYGGGAVLFCNDETVYNNLLYYRQLIHSTSPSYLVMASMDFARNYGDNFGEVEYAEIKRKINGFKGKIGQFKILKNDDFTRLVLYKKNVDMNNVLLQLHAKGIDVECAYKDKLVLIITPANYLMLNEFVKVISKINYEIMPDLNVNIKCKISRRTKNCGVEFVKVEDSLGRVSATEVGIYPPGVPLITCKNIINEEVIKEIINNKDNIFGLIGNKIAVLKEDDE